jgi:hypothetical protein
MASMAAVRDGCEPGGKRSVRIVRLPCSVNREQGFLHDIVDAIARYALAVRHALDHRDTTA